ncbi:SIMPL domain-containing protein [Natronobacterium gregoryi]|uniref:SIMPL domain-containing protein n=2 Tax=Natronobacterium gregoryi TaxID=44930 RepID=L0AE98_NATGS|nr:SIMPL domain-containing protein [Natronobacterium gregoryi]AFZ72228.1 hypothetical protein Natgr_0997 [Natronobacterium gregoryi SP2]ELY62373.1 hypothetical protein C490_18488 [Natronobacterium gregoryi SP2]PLK20175.1 SIMPL domain-containing protein [Natronobacterium gregoryi SP2]SFJ28514.1 hypothetical protein SAMN05443661_12026 [Natronobacterium gregoryi]
MDRRQFLAASGVGAAAVLAGCTGSMTDDERAATGSDDEITVATSGEVEAEPEEATVDVGVEASGASADEVTDELAAGAEQLRETFDELGIPDENVEEGQYRVRPVSGREGEVEEIRGSHSFEVTVDDIDQVGEVIDTTVAAGADDVGRVNFTVREETREELRKDAIDEALENADEEAGHVASNRGVTITGTKSVSTSDVRVHTVSHRTNYEVAMEADDDSPSTEIDADPVSVSASVTVTYGFTDS